MIIWEDENGVVHIRNSERGTLDRCPQQWWWSWREGLDPKETAKALWFGEGIHLALAHYYAPGTKRRKDFIDVWLNFADEEAEYIRTNVGLDEEAYVEARELGTAMLQGYAKHYGGDKNWDVIATEQTFEVRIEAPFLPAGYFILNGTFDGVYYDKHDRKFKLMEHKTAASISTGHLPMDNQAGTYWLVAQTVGRSQGWLKPKQSISYINYNFLRKALPDTRPRDPQGYCTNKPIKHHYIEQLLGVDGWSEADLKKKKLDELESIAAANYIVVLGDRSKQQPPALFERHPVRRTPKQRRMQLTRLQNEVKRMQMYVNGDLEVTKAPGRNTCPMCQFKEMCELHESGGDWEMIREALYRQQDPYAPHRKTA